MTVPAAVLGAGWSLAAFSSGDPTETRYLTVLAAGTLAVVAALAPSQPRELTFGAPLAVLLLWVLPPGPTRGSALTLLLLALLALAAVRASSELLARDIRDAPSAPSWPHLLWTLLPAAVGLQLLLGSGVLLSLALGPSAGGADLLAYLGPPVLTALAVAVLARYRGPAPALAAGAVAVILGAGLGPVPLLGPVPSLGLAALAAGLVLRDPGPVAAWVEGWRVPALRGVAGLVLLAPMVASQRSGALALASGLTLALTGWTPVREPEGGGNRRAWLVLAPVLLVLAAAGLFPLRPWDEAAALLAWLPLTVPAVAVVLLPKISRQHRAGAAGGRWRDALSRRTLMAAFGLALATTLAAPPGLPGQNLPAPLALALPAALAALTLPRGALLLQGLWSSALLGVTVLAASYPWLRPAAPAVALEILAPFFDRQASGWLAAGVLAAAFLVLLALLRLGAPAATVAAAATLGLCLAAYGILPREAHLSRHLGGHTLDREEPSWGLELPGERARRVVLHSHLAHAAGLPAGTPVATVRLLDHRGHRVHWDLTVGEDTAEWATDREGVEAPSPPPWLSHAVSDDGGNPFFGHRYRSVLSLGAHPADPSQPVRLEIERRGDLPPQVELALFHVEVRP